MEPDGGSVERCATLQRVVALATGLPVWHSVIGVSGEAAVVVFLA
jgi:hypothetical protein